MSDPLLLTVSLTGIAYTLIFVLWGWRLEALASPATIVTSLVCIHIFIPGALTATDTVLQFSFAANRAYAVDAVLYTLLSLIALQAACLASKPLPNVQTHNIASEFRTWRRRNITLVLLLLFLAGWIARGYIIMKGGYFQITRTFAGDLDGPFYAAVYMIEQFPQYGLIVVAILYWRKDRARSKTLNAVLLSVLLTEFFYWLPSGRKEPVVLTFLMPLVIRYFRTKRLPSAKSGISLVLFFVLMFPLVGAYRDALYGTIGSDNLVSTAVSAAAMLEGGDFTIDKNPAATIVERISLLESVSATIRLNTLGLWDSSLGKNYFDALYSLLPRAFWPEKPSFHYGNAFGHAAGFLSPGNHLTSISVTYFGEAFLNFGWLGIVPSMILGLFFSFIFYRASESAHQETWLLVYAVSLPSMLYFGGTFALYFGGLIKLLPFFFLLGLLMEWSPKRFHPAISSTAASTKT